MSIYYRSTTFQQRRFLFEMVEQGGDVAEACRRAKVSRKTYYHWKPRYEKEGVDGLREPRSHAVHKQNFSAFFQRMDELCEKSPEKREEGAVTTEDCGLEIFSHEKRSYDEKMDAYVL